jgi:diguanylate cyclase (GGDEF)-like protein/PAS domain S-box-containing protein
MRVRVPEIPSARRSSGNRHCLVTGLSKYGAAGSSRFSDYSQDDCRARTLAPTRGSRDFLEATCQSVRNGEEWYRLIFETSADSIAISRAGDGTYIDCNQAFLNSVGYTREELLGNTSFELGIWSDPDDRRRLVEALERDQACRDLEACFRRKNGEVFWGRMSAALMEIDGAPCILSVTRDFSEAKMAGDRLVASIKALQLSETRYRAVFQSSFDAILIARLGNGTCMDVNPKFLELMGYRRDEVIGRTILELGFWDNLRDRDRMFKILRKQQNCNGFEALLRKKNGSTVWTVLSGSLMEIDGDPSLIVIARDITAAKAAEQEIRNLAFYDQLTHLANRRLLLDRLRQALASCGRTNSTGAVLFIDLDDFKTLNDTLGHRTGDQLLREVAKRISECIREADIVARLGGDEFVVILEDLSQTAEDAASVAELVAEKILSSVAEPCQLAGREYTTTSSIGIALFGDRQTSLDDVMQQADLALYQAKAAGRNAVRFFAPSLQAAVNARAAMEEDLRRAIGTDQFRLVYQPQIDGDRIAGVEALLRWIHPRRGPLPPNDFIPLAEKTGLIVPLGAWILETALAQSVRWSKQDATSHLCVAINISARQFRQPEFVGQVLDALQRTGANPERIRLELTESMLVDNLDDVRAKMQLLRSHGLKLSIDDFGTGYSSLSYLSHLPLDQLKIDRLFVKDMLVDTGSGAIAKAIIALSHTMGLSVVAEGVETDAQRDFLVNSGCHIFQGYLFSPGIEAAELERKLSEPAPGQRPVASTWTAPHPHSDAADSPVDSLPQPA